MNKNIESIFAEDGIIKSLKPDYIPRPSQIEGADKIYDTLSKNENGILEGPCGYGKTFAYLVPMFETIAESEFKKKAVIVTNGISLQEQLYYKDVPLVANIFKEVYPEAEFKFSLLKGKQNFVCPKKVADAYEKKMTAQLSNSPDVVKEIDKLIDWSYKTDTGDLSELDFVASSEALRTVCCVKQGECTSKRCSKFRDCHYYNYRNKSELADIIITNYHMLFADMKTGGMVLPKYDILICDEAHEMPDIYRDFLGYKISVNTLKSLRNEISEVLNGNKYLETMYADTVNTSYMIATAEKYFAEIRSGNMFTAWEDVKLLDTVELKHESNLSEAISITKGVVEQMAEWLQNTIEAITPVDGADYYNMSEKNKEELQAFEVLYNKTGTVLEELCKHLYVLDNYLEESKKKGFAWWIEKDKDKDGSDTHSSSLNYRQVKVGENLNQNFFDKQGLSVILTSATLSVGGNFDFIKEETGLNITDKPILEFIGASPFNLTEQQLWYLPPDAVNGNDKDFDTKFVGQIEKLIFATNGGVLCLFTSLKNMNIAYKELQWSNITRNCTLLKQGMKPKLQLIEQFKEDKNSVLFATRSFFTGIDIPGDALRCVTIDKFPFPSPADPVMQKLSKEDNSFYKYFIPLMVIDLKQAVGRGVRSITDKCVIAILDNRMATARYKKRINDSFSYIKTGTKDLDKVSEFLNTEKNIIEEPNEGNDMPPF